MHMLGCYIHEGNYVKMLVDFKVENYRSFYREQHFSMRAGKYSRLENQVINSGKNRFLKCGMLFGANAAGKTNLIKAVSFARNVVLHGVTPGRLLNRHFRIDGNAIEKPAKFDFEIEYNGNYYNYGFKVSYVNSEIISEWLYVYSAAAKRCIFHREKNQKINSDLNIKDAGVSQRFEIYSEDVAENKTLLNEVVSHKLQAVDEFTPFYEVYKWFDELIIIYPESVYGDYKQFFINDNNKNSLEKMLKYFDTGINGITEEEKSLEDTLAFLPDKVRNDIVSQLKDGFEKEEDADIRADISINNKRISISRNTKGNLVASQLMMNHGNSSELFDLEDESDGTRRLFDLIPIYSKALEDRTILIDELDRSFHSKLTEEFLNKFFSDNINNKSQIIFTTHDTNLLDLNKFRQDEIWFIERMEDHSSKLYSLKEYKTRFDKDIRKEYLENKYGAIPVFVDKDAENMIFDRDSSEII